MGIGRRRPGIVADPHRSCRSLALSENTKNMQAFHMSVVGCPLSMVNGQRPVVVEFIEFVGFIDWILYQTCSFQCIFLPETDCFLQVLLKALIISLTVLVLYGGAVQSLLIYTPGTSWSGHI